MILQVSVFKIWKLFDFKISETLEDVYPAQAAPVANRVYASSDNKIYINSELGNGDWISCNWTTILPRKNMTKFQCMQQFCSTLTANQ